MKARIVIAASGLVFTELAEMIAYSLDEILLRTKGMKFEEILIQDNLEVGPGVAPLSNYPSDFVFVIRAFRKFYPTNMKGSKILFQTEECWNDRSRGEYRNDLLNGVDRVLEMYDENCKLNNAAIVHYCPVGYSPIWEKNLPEVEEDIDVLFHGSLTDRRKNFEFAIRRAGFTAVFSDDLYGLERDKMIMRSKVVINIKAHDKWSYGPLHCLPTQCQMKFMLAERANGGYGPFVPGVHLQEFDGITDCLEKLDYWISHEKERKEFSKSAYENMVRDCNFTNIFATAMKGLI
jgi:hypothetical protein